MFELAYGVGALMLALAGLGIYQDKVERDRKVNSIRYKKWLNYRPDVIEASWEVIE